jgi:predicted transcriptional regulator
MATRKRELSREEILTSFRALPEDSAVEDFIEHLAKIAGLERSAADGDAEEKRTDAALPDRMNKDQLVESLDRLPEDATLDDFLYRLYVISKVERGLAAGKAGKKVPQEKAREHIKRWLR